MKVRISIDKVTALKAGQDKFGPVVVEVSAASLSEAQREFLSQYTWNKGKQPEADFYLDYSTFGEPKACEEIRQANVVATAESVCLMLDRMIEAKVTEDAAKAAKAVREEAEFQAKMQAWRQSPLSERIRRPYSTNWEVSWDCDALCNTPEWAEAKAEADRLNTEESSRKERDAAEKKEREATGQRALLDWANAHGSELLLARIADGFEWQSLARKELAAVVVAPLGEQIATPDGYEYHKTQERTTPTLDEIRALRLVRERLKGQPVEIELAWLTYRLEDGEDYDNEKDREMSRTELSITVTCPDGREVDYFRYDPTAVVERLSATTDV